MGARDTVFDEHLARIKSQTLRAHTLESVPEWICENTFIKGEPFSFEDHEYQLAITRDTSREKNIRKCSQVGISELSVRATLAVLMIIEGSTFIYTMPTATGSKKFAKTRIDPIIKGSPALRAAIDVTADNTELKQLNNSFLYINGTIGAAAAISVPADGVVHDEVDFSDPEVMSNYQSRLKHSPYRLRWRFSTPTVEGYGISAEFENSRQHWNMVKCHHCNHSFVPDYFSHLRIPGFGGDLREIRKDNLHTLNYPDAYIECPGCGKKPSLQVDHREWVVKNSESNFAAAGYQIQPFDAPNVIALGDLIATSTTYSRYVDFVNFELGLPAEDKESVLTQAELEGYYVTGIVPGFWRHVVGIDMGMICHIVIAGVDAYGRMLVVHTERVPLNRIEERLKELNERYRFNLSVMDHQPYTDVLMRLQKSDPNLYAGVYVASQDIQTFKVKKKEKDEDDAQVEVRQVNINRNRALDGLMTFARSGNLALLDDSNKALLIKHMQDMKRVKAFNNAGEKEISYVWRKSANGEDHFHHALLYCWVASQMQGISQSSLILPSLMSKFRIKTEA
jgi:hypothetical protein